MSLSNPMEFGDTIFPNEKAFIEKIGNQFVKIFGIPRIGGRILGLLLISPQPITIEKISKSLFISHGSICTNLRLLILLGLIQKVTFLGERSDFYQFSSTALDQVHKQSVEIIQGLSDLVHKDLNDLSPTGIVRQRMDDIAAWSDLALDMLNQTLKIWKEQLQ